MRFLVFLFLISFSDLFSQEHAMPWNNATSQYHIESGLDDILDYNLRSAEIHFDSLISHEPERPEGYYFKSLCYFWRYIMNENEEDYQTFLRLSDVSEEKTDFFLERYGNEKRPKAIGTYFLAERFAKLGFAQARHKHFASAAINIHLAKGFYKDAFRYDSTFYDSAKGVGFVEFFATLIPSSFKWIATIFGYEGNREEGIARLKLASEKSFYSRKESKFYISAIQFLFYKNLSLAESDLLSLAKSNPNSTVLNYTLGLFYFQTKRYDRAKIYLELAIGDLKRDGENAFSLYAIYRYGELLFRSRDFENAVTYFQKFQQVGNYTVYHAQTQFRLGLCYEFSGRRTESLQFYKQAFTSTPENQDEVYSERKAKFYLNNPITEIQKLLWFGRNAFDAGDYQSSLQFLEPLINQATTFKPDEQAELFYRLGRTYDESGQNENAIQFYQSCFVIAPKEEKLFAPFAHFNLGKLYSRLGKTDLARQEFQATTLYDGYDYQSGLERDVKFELEKLP